VQRREAGDTKALILNRQYPLFMLSIALQFSWKKRFPRATPYSAPVLPIRPKAADPVEWDLFRTAILEGQGWKLMRLWTPQAKSVTPCPWGIG
jgi:hypothetical protein